MWGTTAEFHTNMVEIARGFTKQRQCVLFLPLCQVADMPTRRVSCRCNRLQPFTHAAVVFSVFVISDNNFVLPFFSYHLNFRCRIFSLHNFCCPFSRCRFFRWRFFPLSLFHTLISCCPVFVPSHFSLLIFLIAQFSGCPFFRCRFCRESMG